MSHESAPDLIPIFERRLNDLGPCLRCEVGQHVQCEDRWLAYSNAMRPSHLTCGCGCWSRQLVGSIGIPDGRLRLVHSNES